MQPPISNCPYSTSLSLKYPMQKYASIHKHPHGEWSNLSICNVSTIWWAVYIAPNWEEQTLISPRPNTPKLSLSIELQCLGGPTIAKENSNNVLIYHIHRDLNDGHEWTCTIYWFGTFEAFGSQGFVLLRHTTDGQLKKVEGVAERWRDDYLPGRSFWAS